MRVPAINSWLSPADIGRRVSVRRQASDGLHDTVGTLVAWEGAPRGELLIRTRDGGVHRVTASSITAGRVVAPAVSALRLQEIAEAAWPVTDSEHLGQWNLRFGGGKAWRTNSARLCGDPGNDTAAALEFVRAWYERRGVPGLVQTPDPGAFDSHLVSAGWVPDTSTQVMVRTVTADHAQHARAVVEVTEAPTPEWRTVAAPDLARGLDAPLERAHHQRFITVFDDGQPVSVGRIVAQSQWGIATSVRTISEAQRQGFARTTMAVINDVARELGVGNLFLQVLEANEAGMSLYRDLAFETHHRYRYFLAPTA